MSTKSLKRSGQRRRLRPRRSKDSFSDESISDDSKTDLDFENESETSNKNEMDVGKTRKSSNRSSRRMRSCQKKTFHLPRRREVWDKIAYVPHSQAKLDQYRPRKVVNNFITGSSRYNYDPAYTSGEDSVTDFVVGDDEVEYEENASQSSDSSTVSWDGKDSYTTDSDRRSSDSSGSRSSIGSSEHSDGNNSHNDSQNDTENVYSCTDKNGNGVPACATATRGYESDHNNIEKDRDNSIVQNDKTENNNFESEHNQQIDGHPKVTSVSSSRDNVHCSSSSLPTTSCESHSESDGSSNEYKKRYKKSDDSDSLIYVILLQSDPKIGNSTKSSKKGDNCSPVPSKQSLNKGFGKQLGSCVTPSISTDELAIHSDHTSDEATSNRQRKRKKLRCSRPKKQKRTNSLSSSSVSDSSEHSDKDSSDSGSFSKKKFKLKLRQRQKAQVTRKLFNELRAKRQKKKIRN